MVKNNSITFWRLAFTVLVALFHFLRLYDLNTGWYISVEFFFITSGFLLINTCDKKRNKAGISDSPWIYTKKRIARLYPMYLFCFILNFVIYSRILYPSVTSKMQELLESIYELIGIQMVGLNQDIYFNNVAWYVSALLIAGYFIYYMVLNHRKFYIQFVCPISVILIYSFYYRIYTGMEMWGDSIGFWQHDALLRALAGMNMGIMSYQLCNKIKDIRLTAVSEYILDAAEIFSFLFIIIYTAIVHNTDNDYAIVIFMAVAVALAFGHRRFNSVFNNKLINYLSGLTYAMYLNHAILISVFKRFAPELNALTIAAFFAILLIMSVVSQFIVDKCVYICANIIKPKLIQKN